MGVEWLAIIMFAIFLVLLLVGYPVAFSFAGTAIVFGAVGILLGRIRLQPSDHPLQPLVQSG